MATAKIKWKKDFIIGCVLGAIMLGIRIGPPIDEPTWTYRGAAGTFIQVLLVATFFTVISHLDKIVLKKKKRNKD